MIVTGREVINMSISLGLEDVFIKYTSLTSIDGEKGELRYRGYDIKDLVEHCSFEEVAYLMFYGELPKRDELEHFKSNVMKNYKIPENVKNIIKNMPRDGDALAIMEAAFAALSTEEYTWEKERDREKAAEIMGRALGIVSAVFRYRDGREIKDPENKGYAEAFLNACFDSGIDEDKIKAMNAALILYIDHEVPASTTAALVASSTLSDMYSCVTAAIAALKGPLHGGAAEAAYKQFLAIKSPENVDSWFNENILNNKKRLMGFGHRVYKTYDPRMLIFKELARKNAKTDEQKKILELAERLEALGVKNFGQKKIFPNTDYYSGIVFNEIGFPLYMFTTLFALSRVVGWVAHISEYVESEERLIRPRAIYIGPEKRDVVPIDKR
ncbi:citrate synthase [Picrophilus oshimae DSM 9789]|uniref:Citrate synthase n=2 Tax=Picrophilus torridus (strain ATCC 700027 / DSM 9790 / JCM 10055 / NBRC 100828 / KAW 2/3) TaxID=1122961 RepID=A0A8G2FVF7_PICTO|nr:citrate synthase [Picrophilus oshimae DSM 9789]